jgi:hypothetical protein
MLNFPDSPTLNQVFNAYTWDGEKWINTVGGIPMPDSAPTITSSATVSNVENAVLAHSLTASESVTWSLVGGADQARFELSGSTLRWLSNGTKDFEAPNDADANNVYVVTVRATDSGSQTTNQTISVTVTDVGETWTPVALTGLIGWWDASVTASLTIGSGSKITNIADQSGAANHLGNGSTTEKPTYNATGFNSRPGMVFATALDTRINSTSAFPMGTGNTVTFFVVTTIESNSDLWGGILSYLAAGQSNSTDNVASWSLLRSVSNPVAAIWRNGVTSIATGMSYSTPYRLIGTINSSGLMTLYVNGVASGTTGTQAGNWVTAGTATIGKAGNFLFNGVLAECGIATGFSDATTVAALDTYLKNKWGLQYATWDPATASNATLSNGNLTLTSTGGSTDHGAHVASTAGKITGKYYFEVTLTTDAGGGNSGFGVGTTASTYAGMGLNATSGGLCYVNGSIYANGSNTGSTINNPATGQVVGIAVDLTAHKIWFINQTAPGVNYPALPLSGWNGDVSNGSGHNPATGVGGMTLPSGTIVPFATFNASGNVYTANFGASAFSGAVPSGFTSGWTV